MKSLSLAEIITLRAFVVTSVAAIEKGGTIQNMHIHIFGSIA
jgi:hypothetical protein